MPSQGVLRRTDHSLLLLNGILFLIAVGLTYHNYSNSKVTPTQSPPLDAETIDEPALEDSQAENKERILQLERANSDLLDTSALMALLHGRNRKETDAPTSAPTREDYYQDNAFVPDFDYNPAATRQRRPEAEIVGNNRNPREAWPLQKCQGDCDSDADCDWGLSCHQRANRNDNIPGCRFSALEVDNRFGVQDFCIESPRILPEAFRLKMYWEEGYVWQNDTEEMHFCMTSHYPGYFNGPCCRGFCWYGNLTEPCRRDQVYIERCRNAPGEQSSFALTSEQQAFRFLKLDDLLEETTPVSRQGQPEQVLIQSAYRADQRCLERDFRTVWLQKCDPMNRNQRWMANDKTSFFNPDDNRFEISQRSFRSQCLASAHHPKSGEVVEMHFCEDLRAPDSQTGKWTKY